MATFLQLISVTIIQGWVVKTAPGFNRPGKYSLSGQYYYLKWKMVNFVLFHI